jgi:hypothetical protein
MGWTETWCDLLDDEEAAEMVTETARETLESLDPPPPGLKTWLEQHGLGLIPVDRDAFYGEDSPELSRVGERHTEEGGDPPSLRIGAHPPEDTLRIGDYVSYQLAQGNETKIGHGRVMRLHGDLVLIDTGYSRIEAYFSLGDSVERVPST